MSDPHPFNVKSSIMAALEETEDKAMRTILLLLLGVFEHVGGELSGLNTKLDAILADERALKDKVLNGHADFHDADHEWIRIQRALPANPACAWAATKMAEDIEAKKDAALDKRKVRDKIIEIAVTLAAGATLATAGLQWAAK